MKSITEQQKQSSPSHEPEYCALLDWAKRARDELRILKAICESMPAPKLAEWNWPQILASAEKLLAELPE